MRPLKESSDSYFKELEQRAKKSRAFTLHQLIGLEISTLLDDQRHKSLYIKLAKEYDASHLLQLAKSVAEKRNVTNPGAYFMKVFKEMKDAKMIRKIRA